MQRAPFLLLGILSLLVGIAGGLGRIGWALPVPAGAVDFHGPLMIAGFLGTVIGLERAVAAGRRWGYVGPVCTGAGTLLFALAGGDRPARALVVVGAGVLVAVVATALRGRVTRWNVTHVAGAGSFLVGSLLWLGNAELPRVLPWWEGFLVLTITGERLELSRVLEPGRHATALFAGLVGLFATGMLASAVDPLVAPRICGVAWLGLALWMARWDLARRSLRRPGLARFMAVSVLSGLVWLGAAGLLAQGPGAAVVGPWYSASLHSLFLGFVFAMIFGHGPVIFPAILRRRIRFHPRFYGHLALLHASVLLRVASDLAGWTDLRAWSGLLSALAILAFLVQTVTSIEWRR